MYQLQNRAKQFKGIQICITQNDISKISVYVEHIYDDGQYTGMQPHMSNLTPVFALVIYIQVLFHTMFRLFCLPLVD